MYSPFSNLYSLLTKIRNPIFRIKIHVFLLQRHKSLKCHAKMYNNCVNYFQKEMRKKICFLFPCLGFPWNYLFFIERPVSHSGSRQRQSQGLNVQLRHIFETCFCRKMGVSVVFQIFLRQKGEIGEGGVNKGKKVN